MSSPGTSGGDRVTNGACRGTYAVLVGVVLAFGVVNALSEADDAFRRGGAYDLGRPLLWELTSTVIIAALAPLIDVAIRRLRRTGSWPLRAAWAAGTVLVFSALHIVGMVALRKLVLALGGGSYHFDFSAAELLYELRKDVVTCLLIGSAFWLIASRRDIAAAQAVAAAPAGASPPDQLWLRDGAARLRVDPRDVVWVSSAGNYVEYRLADGRTHLVRGTLAAEEARLVPFQIVRVHRTRLVNLSRVVSLRAAGNGDFELTLDTGQTLTGSRRYRAAVSSIAEPAGVPAPPGVPDAPR